MANGEDTPPADPPKETAQEAPPRARRAPRRTARDRLADRIASDLGAAGESATGAADEASRLRDEFTPPKPPRKGSLERELTDALTFMGVAVSALNFTDGHIIMTNAAPVASAWANLADTNPRVKRQLERMLQGGAWGAAITATAGMVVPILLNHGLGPTIPGVGSLFGNAPDFPPADNGNAPDVG